MVLEVRGDLRYNRPLTCQNELTNHTPDTVLEPTGSVRVFQLRPVEPCWSAAALKAALNLPFNR